MGLKARILTLAHFIITFGLAIILAVGFASNNWIEARYLKSTHNVIFTSGLFLGCLNFPNRTSLCSKKIVYGARATFNLNLGEEPDEYLLKLVNLAYDMFLLQPINTSLFHIDEEFFDEGKLTFTNVFTFYDAKDSDSIFCARYLVAGGLFLTVLSAMMNFFLSCVYSVKATKIVIGIFVIGSVMTTMGSNIMYIPYTIDKFHVNPEMDIYMGFGMILTIIGVVGILAMAVLLSVTLLTVEKAKIRDMVKTANLVNRATATMARNTARRTLPQNIAKETNTMKEDHNTSASSHNSEKIYPTSPQKGSNYQDVYVAEADDVYQSHPDSVYS